MRLLGNSEVVGRWQQVCPTPFPYEELLGTMEAGANECLFTGIGYHGATELCPSVAFGAP
jgi:hypothetical protein